MSRETNHCCSCTYRMIVTICKDPMGKFLTQQSSIFLPGGGWSHTLSVTSADEDGFTSFKWLRVCSVSQESVSLQEQWQKPYVDLLEELLVLQPPAPPLCKWVQRRGVTLHMPSFSKRGEHSGGKVNGGVCSIWPGDRSSKPVRSHQLVAPTTFKIPAARWAEPAEIHMLLLCICSIFFAKPHIFNSYRGIHN